MDGCLEDLGGRIKSWHAGSRCYKCQLLIIFVTAIDQQQQNTKAAVVELLEQ
jgi:hypothetical protein